MSGRGRCGRRGGFGVPCLPPALAAPVFRYRPARPAKQGRGGVAAAASTFLSLDPQKVSVVSPFPSPPSLRPCPCLLAAAFFPDTSRAWHFPSPCQGNGGTSTTRRGQRPSRGGPLSAQRGEGPAAPCEELYRAEEGREDGTVTARQGLETGAAGCAVHGEGLIVKPPVIWKKTGRSSRCSCCRRAGSGHSRRTEVSSLWVGREGHEGAVDCQSDLVWDH